MGKRLVQLIKSRTGNHLCQRLYFNKVAGLRPATLLKRGLWRRCFPVNFGKFLRTPFLTEHLRWLLLLLNTSKNVNENHLGKQLKKELQLKKMKMKIHLSSNLVYMNSRKHFGGIEVSEALKLNLLENSDKSVNMESTVYCLLTYTFKWYLSRHERSIY